MAAAAWQYGVLRSRPGASPDTCVCRAGIYSGVKVICFRCLGTNWRGAEWLLMKCYTRGCGSRSGGCDRRSWELAHLEETGKRNLHGGALADAWREEGWHVPWEIMGRAGKTDNDW